METKLVELNEFELLDIEGGSLFVIACCAIAYATGLATALMIL
jgi:hypothetical protein